MAGAASLVIDFQEMIRFGVLPFAGYNCMNQNLRESVTPLTLLVMLWCAVMPITSFLVIPSIQGTTPAVMCAIIGGLCLISRPAAWVSIALITLYFIATYCSSQFLLQAYGNVVAGDLRCIELDTDSLLYRTSTLTQGLYFIPSVIVFLFFRYYFKDQYLKYVFLGAWLLVLYGFYDWSYTFIFGESGDFIANRKFEQIGTVGEREGSRAQFLMLGPLRLLRFKSFTGEPSFFAIIAIPYLALAYCTGRTLLSLALCAALALSFSTSGYLGIVVVFGVIALVTRRLDSRILLGFLAVFALFALILIIYPKMFEQMFTDKFSASNASGKERSYAYTYALEFFWNLPFWLKFVGIGFGVTYLPGTLRTLVDLGVIGFAFFIRLFLKPCFTLSAEPFHVGLRSGLAAMFVLYSIACEEIFLPTTAMFLGIAYNQLDLLYSGWRHRH